MVIRHRLRKQRATAAMQHAGRFMFAQLLMSALKVLQSKRADHDDVSAKAGMIFRVILGWRGRRAARQRKDDKAVQDKAATKIQARARGMLGRRKGAAVSSDYDMRYAAAQTVQAYTRRFHAQITHGAYIKALRLKLPTVQRTVRGFNARRKVAYEKYCIALAWRWVGLGNDAPSRRWVSARPPLLLLLLLTTTTTTTYYYDHLTNTNPDYE